ncbi:PepSY domain-containing protein [Flavicella sediminum]|uniref:PepSY domain-containing protein n=1 Tax=Flavicella sediminum TaxID=2585141 RepID=UPI0011224675|nr:PepSY domain-containing protein [Flavicella sediminum]
MLKKLWRYSHLTLTVSSSLFLLLAAITGAFLAFKPIQEKLQPFKINAVEEIAVSQLIETLQAKYDEVLELEVDKNYFVKASVFSMDKELNAPFFMDPITGTKIGDIPKANPFFEFLTDFHRSLFLKTPGRIFVGITSFLLCLIAITGLLLAIKRQGGFVKLFSNIIKDKSVQYNHVALGRILLIPIFIIALSGTYLSMDRFSLLPAEARVIRHNEMKSETIPFADFEIFKNTTLKEVTKIEFPFSTDAEDYFTLILKDRELQVHQKTGAIVKETVFPFVQLLSVLSFNLHTGAGSVLWSLVLFISSLGILYFMYSGTVISIQRLRGNTKNKWKAHEANLVILTGSENGSTKSLGKILYKALLKENKKVFLDDLNNYQSYKNMEQLLILTATYGDGEPPSNANLFLKKLEEISIEKTFECHVLGFGSFSYPDFCAFGKEVYQKVVAHEKIQVPQKEALLIHNQNYKQFKDWATNWGKSLEISLSLPAELTSKKNKEILFKIKAKQSVKDAFDETFTLTLTSEKKQHFLPGDLLSIIPPNENIERLYSIGKTAEGDLLLSIKKHELGICSNYLNELKVGEEFEGTIQQNKAFHLPKKPKNVALIANGTGIAPFLGMMHEKTNTKCTLYWGTRTFVSLELYKNSIIKAHQKGNLQSYNFAFSKEKSDFSYVQDFIQRDEKDLVAQLKEGDCLMLCGSIAMRDTVFKQLDEICLKYDLETLEFYKNKGQILTDCY